MNGSTITLWRTLASAGALRSLAATAACLLFAASCAPHATAPSHATPSPEASKPKPLTAIAREPPPDLDVRLDGVIAPRPALVVRLEARSPARAFELAGALPERVHIVEARDARGPLAISLAPGQVGTDLLLSRDPSPPLRITYEVLAPAHDGVTTDSPATLPELFVDENHARIPGELVASPRDQTDGELDVRLELGTLAGRKARGASTLAASTTFRGKIRASELRGAFAILGSDVGTARFHAYEGDDGAVWVGFTSFDPRWVAAESAGIRSSVDRYFGARSVDRHALAIVAAGRRPELPFAMVSRPRALWISADVSAPWDGGARLRLGQHLVQRFLGGALWIGERSASGEAAGWFWSEGAARTVAREVLFEMDLLSLDEVAAEVNVALAELALSDRQHASLDALAAAAAGPEPAARAARAAIAARGLLWSTALEARLRVKPAAGGLRGLLRALFGEAAQQGNRTLSLEELAAAISKHAGDDEGRRLIGEVRRGAPIEPASNLLGTCYRRERRKVSRFELGFSWSAAPAGRESEPRRVGVVVPGSAAHRAGLRDGDAVIAAIYQPGRADVKAKLEVASAGAARRRVEFYPHGEEAEGFVFLRKPDARDETCSR